MPFFVIVCKGNESFSTNALKMNFASLKENEMTEALAILKKIVH